MCRKQNFFFSISQNKVNHFFLCHFSFLYLVAEFFIHSWMNMCWLFIWGDPAKLDGMSSMQIQNKIMFPLKVFLLTSCFSVRTVTPWLRPETAHQADLHWSLCLYLLRWYWGLSQVPAADRTSVCFVTPPAAISHNTPPLISYAWAQQELRFVISYLRLEVSL